MKVEKISQYITPKTTGYAATAGLVLSAASGFSRNKLFRKTHKPIAVITTILTGMHIGLVEYYHYKFRKKY